MFRVVLCFFLYVVTYLTGHYLSKHCEPQKDFAHGSLFLFFTPAFIDDYSLICSFI